jgi:hypothetical protein
MPHSYSLNCGQYHTQTASTAADVRVPKEPYTCAYVCAPLSWTLHEYHAIVISSINMHIIYVSDKEALKGDRTSKSM